MSDHQGTTKSNQTKRYKAVYNMKSLRVAEAQRSKTTQPKKTNNGKGK